MAATGTTRNDPEGRPRDVSDIAMFLLAPIVAYAPVLAVGTGWSPLLYFLGAIAVALIGSAILRRTMRRPWIGQIALLGTIAGGAAAVGVATSRPDPARPFALMFKTPPPLGVAGLAARVQWYDGPTTLIRFAVDEDTLATLLKAGGLRPSERFDEVPQADRRAYVDRSFYMSGIADPGWRRTIMFQSARLYEFSPGRIGLHTPENGVLLVNERGEAWGMYNWGG